MKLSRRAIITGLAWAFSSDGAAKGLEEWAASPADSAERAEMKALINEVLAMTGLHNEVRVVIDPRVKGCAYAATRNGVQEIGVNLSCVGPVRSDGEYNWRAVGALTHEIGHLLSGHTATSIQNHKQESEADEWAGWAMYRLGATLDEAQTLFRTLDPAASKTHPGRDARLEAVAQGWNRARSDAERRRPQPVLEPPDPPPPRLPQPRTEPISWGDILKLPVPWAQHN